MSVKCKICSKAIYPMDPQINLDGSKFHKTCAKCAECGCQITLSNFTKNQTEEQTLLLCKIHYFKRFHEGGSYVGGDKFRVKSDRDVQNSLKTKDHVEITKPEPTVVRVPETVFKVVEPVVKQVSEDESVLNQDNITMATEEVEDKNENTDVSAVVTETVTTTETDEVVTSDA